MANFTYQQATPGIRAMSSAVPDDLYRFTTQRTSTYQTADELAHTPVPLTHPSRTRGGSQAAGALPTRSPARPSQIPQRRQRSNSPLVDDALRSDGRPLDNPVRLAKESRLDADLSGVRVHTDDTADRAARSLGASAFTVGHDIVFRADRYSPYSQVGKHILTHELAHVVQQAQAPQVRPTDTGTPGDAWETAAEAAAAGRPMAAGPAGAVPGLQRYDAFDTAHKGDDLTKFRPYYAEALAYLSALVKNLPPDERNFVPITWEHLVSDEFTGALGALGGFKAWARFPLVYDVSGRPEIRWVRPTEIPAAVPKPSMAAAAAGKLTPAVLPTLKALPIVAQALSIVGAAINQLTKDSATAMSGSDRGVRAVGAAGIVGGADVAAGIGGALAGRALAQVLGRALGRAAGATVGAAGGPFDFVTVPLFSLLGGIVGARAASFVTEGAYDYLLRWVDFQNSFVSSPNYVPYFNGATTPPPSQLFQFHQ